MQRGALVAAGVLAAMSANVAPAQSRSPAVADAALQRQADSLQRCLESRLAPLQVETTVSTEGRVTESIRMTRWGAAAQAGDLADLAISTCTSPQPTSTDAGACTPAHGLQRVVALEFTAGEPHPAWSSNDRARLEDLIPATLADLSGHVRVRTTLDGTTSDSTDVLRVRLDYRGSNLSQRDLDDWVRMPREALLRIELVDRRAGNRVVAAREMTARVRSGLRGRFVANTGDAWFREVKENLVNATQTVLEPLACRPAQFEVTAERGKLQLSALGFTGLEAGRSVLLVPTADAATASRWPIARIRALPRTDMAELELLRGTAEACTAGCRAVLL